MNEELIDLKKAMKLLNVKESWIRMAIFKRAIPYVKIGRQIRFRNTDLIRFINQNTKENIKAKEDAPME